MREPIERRHLIKDIKRIFETGIHPPDKRFDVLFERVPYPARYLLEDIHEMPKPDQLSRPLTVKADVRVVVASQQVGAGLAVPETCECAAASKVRSGSFSQRC